MKDYVENHEILKKHDVTAEYVKESKGGVPQVWIRFAGAKKGPSQ